MLARTSILALALLPSLGTAQQLEAARLVPPGPDQPIGAGNAVALAGDWAFVGAFSPRGVYVYRRSPLGWTFHQAIRGPESAIGFAWRLAASDDVLAVGAFYEDAPGVSRAGKVYLFHCHGNGQWAFAQTLQPKGLREWDLFGSAVATHGDTLVVSAPGVDQPGMANVGAAFVYKRSETGHWSLRQRLDYPGDYSHYSGGIGAMGLSVDVWGDTLVAGATNAVFVFERGEKGWERSALLTHDLKQNYGRTVALAGRTVVVSHTSKGAALGGTPGSALVYEKGVAKPGEWTLVQEIAASDGFVAHDHNDQFSEALDTDGQNILVGASNGNFKGDFSGTAYLFRRHSDGSWPPTETAKLVSSAPQDDGESLGFSVALDTPNLLAGAHSAGPPAMAKGAGFLFEIEEGESFCPAKVNSTGRAGHLAFLATGPGGDIDLLSVSNVVPGTAAFALAAPGADAGLDQAFGKGKLCLGWGGVTRLPLVFSTGPEGAFQHAIDPGDPIGQVLGSGTTWSFQVVYRDDMFPGVKFFNTTNAVTVTLP